MPAPSQQATRRRRVASTAGAALLSTAMAAAVVAVFSLHLGLRPVLSASMRPSIEPGSLLVTRPVPVTDVHPGDVIVFSAPGHVGSFVHRVVSVTPGSAGPIVQTRGDANGQVDPWRAQLVARNVPEVVTAVPWVGRLATSGQRWIPMAVLMACGLAVTGLGARMVLRGGSATPATVA